MNAVPLQVAQESLPASRKIHKGGTVHPGIRVPMREISLHASSGEGTPDGLRFLGSVHGFGCRDRHRAWPAGGCVNAGLQRVEMWSLTTAVRCSRSTTVCTPEVSRPFRSS